jgi:hypothetical protein
MESEIIFSWWWQRAGVLLFALAIGLIVWETTLAEDEIVIEYVEETEEISYETSRAI